MNKLLVTIATAALLGTPMATSAQDRDRYQGDGRETHASSAAARGADASARVREERRGNAGYARVDRSRYAADRYTAGRYGSQRWDGRGHYRDDPRFRGGVTLGFGYDARYPAAGYADGGEPYGAGYAYGGGDAYNGDVYGGDYAYGDDDTGGYGADYAYSSPDTQGTYAPFAYSYSTRDDAYYANQGAQAYGREGYDGGQAAPNAGWSRGAGQDCGQWVWRDDRGAYQWAPAPCEQPR